MAENRPMWVMGEDGAEIPVSNLPFYDEMDVIDMTAIDKKTMRAIKWQFLKTAIKFFFSR